MSPRRFNACDMSGAECSPYIWSGEFMFLSWYARDAYANVCTYMKIGEIEN